MSLYAIHLKKFNKYISNKKVKNCMHFLSLIYHSLCRMSVLWPGSYGQSYDQSLHTIYNQMWKYLFLLLWFKIFSGIITTIACLYPRGSLQDWQFYILLNECVPFPLDILIPIIKSITLYKIFSLTNVITTST